MSSKYLDEGRIVFPTPFGLSEFMSFISYINDEVPCKSSYKIDIEVTHPPDESEDELREDRECLGRFYTKDSKEFFNIKFTNKGKISSIIFCSYNSYQNKYMDGGEPSELLKIVCEKADEFLMFS